MDSPGMSFSDPILDHEHKKRIEQILTVIFSQQPGTPKVGQMQKEVPDLVDTGLSELPDAGFLKRITGLISGKTRNILPLKKKAENKRDVGQKTVFNSGFSSKGPLPADSGIGKVLAAFTGVFDTMASHLPDKPFFEDLIGSLLGKKIKIVSSKKKAVNPGRMEQKKVKDDKSPSNGFLSAPRDAGMKQTGSTDARVSDIPKTGF